MMMCSRCKKRPAVVFITSLQGAEKKNEGLCLVCAKELNIPQVDEYMKQMGITEEELEQISNQMMDLMDGENFEMGGSGVLPQFFQNVYLYFPFPYAINAMREAISGMYEMNYFIYMGKLLIFAAASLLLGLVIRKPFIPLNHFFEEKMKETKMM